MNMKSRDFFKIAMITNNTELYSQINKRDSIFGIEFYKSFTETSGASFAYSHFNLGDNRITAQFWMLEADGHWSTVRKIYLKGSAGLIILTNGEKNAFDIINKLMLEYMSTTRFDNPIIIIDMADMEKDMRKVNKYAKSIERWAGYRVPVIHIATYTENEINNALTEFIYNVKTWLAKNVLFSTLRLYFNLDSINHEKRSVSSIVKQMRKIYVSRYYHLVSDKELAMFIRQAALLKGYKISKKDDSILYERDILPEPYSIFFTPEEDEDEEIRKPRVERLK